MSNKQSYAEAYQAAASHPSEFWGEAAQALDWDTPPDSVLSQNDAGEYQWFAGGKLNLCYNCIDRHVANGRAEQTALIYESPVTQTAKTYSFALLQTFVAKFAGGLQKLGVGQGDRVVIYMPMIPEAVFAMLACARIGAIHSVVFGGFSAQELAKRINDAKPKVIVSASHGIEPSRVINYKEIVDEAQALATHQIQHSVVFQREELPAYARTETDIDGDQFLAEASAAECVPVDADHPLYILYTSGTTGAPKGVVRDTGGYGAALAWSMQAIYGVSAGEVFWAASDIGWVVGHSYIVYGPLLQGCTTVLFEGKPVGTPDAAAYWRVIEKHAVKTMFTAPTAIRAIKTKDFAGQLFADFDVSSLQALFLAGERADPDTLRWAEELLGVPVLDHWWQTETGWPACSYYAGLENFPVKHGSSGRPVPGFDIQVLDEANTEVTGKQVGDIAIKLPLPPGCLTTLWQNHEHYKDTYLRQHPGYYQTGDAGFIDEEGYLQILSRTDDIINVAGHRLSTGEMEEAVSDTAGVAECAVIGVQDALKGEVPLALIVVYPDQAARAEQICSAVVQSVREKIGPVAALKTVVSIPQLPKTRSGKVLRRTLRAMANGEAYTVPPTIEDPTILEPLERTLESARAPAAQPNGSAILQDPVAGGTSREAQS